MSRPRAVTPARQPLRGQLWRAPSLRARGGFRYVRIERVYKPALAIWSATARETSKSGRELRPDYPGPTGELISTSFDIGLNPDHTMPVQYELYREKEKEGV